MLKKIVAFAVFLFFAFCSGQVHPSPPLTEAQVFQWWDDGLLNPEEASEILDLIQEENFEEACQLAQALALETCKQKPSQKKEKITKEQPPPSLTPEGYVSWTARIDSLGNLERQYLDINIQFYRYSLRLGTHSQLAYRNRGSEAYFGQISTKEFHSFIPTDTLWGTAVLYPLGDFNLQGALDTALHAHAAIGFKPQKAWALNMSLWHNLRASDSTSVAFQLKSPWGEMASWYQQGQDSPLTKIRLQKKSDRKKSSAQISWQTTAYIHGKEVPEVARLSSSLQKNTFTGTQQLAVHIPALGNSKLAANARLFLPQESDSLKGRVKISTETGPQVFRAAGSITCLETHSRCPQNDFQMKLSSDAVQAYTLTAAVKTRHTRREGFSVPRTEAALSYHPTSQLFARAVLQLPKGRPQEKLQIRTETTLKTAHLQSQLVVTFRRMPQENFHPIHGIFRLKWLF